MKRPVLYIFAGLPGTGKSTLARELAHRADATYLRIDTIEQALRDLTGIEVEGEGYRLAYRVAADNLANSRSVVADSCNPIKLTRDEWEAVAHGSSATFVNIEVTCSDSAEHRRRVETRPSAVVGLKLPTWNEVKAREYHTWDRPRILIDTAVHNPQESLDELWVLLQEEGRQTGNR